MTTPTTPAGPGGGNPPAAPGGGGYGAAASKPSNYLVPAILTTIFCCLPAGIVSIVFAAQVNGKYNAGDIAGAQDSSRKARTWFIVALVVGLVIDVIYLIGRSVSGGGSSSALGATRLAASLLS